MQDITKLTFIGGGNMARSIIGGLVQDGYPASAIFVADHQQDKLEALQANFGITPVAKATAAVQQADTVLLCVKPQAMYDTLAELKEELLARSPLLITVAAGLPLSAYSKALGHEFAMVRAMPNTPSLVQMGATGLFANAACSSAHCLQAQEIFAAVGSTTWVDDEALLEEVMAISGCGPAYYFLFTELLAKIGHEHGLTAPAAEQLAKQTLLGAASMVEQSDEPLAVLRQRVAAPGGSTQQALDCFMKEGLPELIGKALQAAKDRGLALAKMLE